MDETKRKPKRFTVLYPGERRKVGIVAEHFEQLLSSACAKFKLPFKEARLLLNDGTEVDDDEYFSYLPEDTTFILATKAKVGYSFWSSAMDLLGKIWRLPAPPKEKMNALIDELMSNKEMRCRLQEALSASTLNLEDNKSGDPDWFRGIPDRFKSKNEWMRKNAKDRIRGYYIRTKDDVENRLTSKRSSCENFNDIHRVFNSLFDELRGELNRHSFYGGYFCRRDRTYRLCDDSGWFLCQGEFDALWCGSDHRINPYGNRDSRILFSTWNLDHVIERSRNIIPALGEAILTGHNRKIQWRYFYNLLFVAKGKEADQQESNLKLVHIVCHVKASHTKYICDKKKYFEKEHKPK